jgi:oligosaccharide repeat unit polymerase
VPTLQFAYYNEYPVAAPRYFSYLFKVAVTFVPLYFIQNRSLGLLHPFVLPSLFTIAKDLFKNVDGFAERLVVTPPVVLTNEGLEHLSRVEIAWTEVIHNIFLGGSLLIVYATYFGLSKIKPPELNLRPAINLIPKLLVVAGIGALIGFYIIQKQGGIEQSIYAMGFGRFRQRDAMGGGHYAAFSTLLTIATYIWFAARRSAMRNPLFYGLLALSLVISFIVTGSRSGVIYQIVTLICLYIAREHKVPSVAIGLSALVAVVVVGALGQLRRSSNYGSDLNWEAVTEISAEGSLSAAAQEIKHRPSGSFMIIGEAMDRVGPLWGRSYMGVLTFFVPRFVWPNKPRGGGAYANSLLLGNGQLEKNISGGDGQSIPISWQSESYWNFHLVGLLLASFMAGGFYRIVANIFVKYRNVPIVWVFYFFCLFTFRPQSDGMIVFIQNTILLLIVAIILGYWRPITLRNGYKRS